MQTIFLLCEKLLQEVSKVEAGCGGVIRELGYTLLDQKNHLL